jgi:hypothetical protein
MQNYRDRDYVENLCNKTVLCQLLAAFDDLWSRVNDEQMLLFNASSYDNPSGLK